MEIYEPWYVSRPDGADLHPDVSTLPESDAERSWDALSGA
jgi:hypothetical protein